jgi:hypothetical protein
MRGNRKLHCRLQTHAELGHHCRKSRNWAGGTSCTKAFAPELDCIPDRCQRQKVTQGPFGDVTRYAARTGERDQRKPQRPILALPQQRSENDRRGQRQSRITLLLAPLALQERSRDRAVPPHCRRSPSEEVADGPERNQIGIGFPLEQSDQERVINLHQIVMEVSQANHVPHVVRRWNLSLALRSDQERLNPTSPDFGASQRQRAIVHVFTD